MTYLPRDKPQWCGFISARSRIGQLQRRPRDGFTPSSLLHLPAHAGRTNPIQRIVAIVAGDKRVVVRI